MNSWFGFIKEGFLTFSGGNGVFLLYVPALVYLFFAGKKERRLVWPPLTAVILLCNPLTVYLFSLKATYSNRYARVFWVHIPFFVIAYAFTVLLGRLKGMRSRIFAAAVFIAAVIALGVPSYAKDTNHAYTLPENSYYLSYQAIFLSQLYHSEGIAEPRVLYDGFLMQSVRLFDPTVHAEITRKEEEALEKNGKLDKETLADPLRRTIGEVYGLENEDIPPEEFVNALRERQVDYVTVRPDTFLYRYLRRCGLTYLGGAGDYLVYKVRGEE